jgi:hypothetical protein
LPKKEATRIEEKKRLEIKQLRDACLMEIEKEFLIDTKNRDIISKKAMESGELIPFLKPYDKKGEKQKCLDKYSL